MPGPPLNHHSAHHWRRSWRCWPSGLPATPSTSSRPCLAKAGDAVYRHALRRQESYVGGFTRQGGVFKFLGILVRALPR